MTFIALTICIYAAATQRYTSFIVKGDVTVIVDGKSRVMLRGEEFDESTIIHVGEGAYLTLKSNDKKHHTLTINHPYNGSIKGIKQVKGAKVKRTSAFMDVIRGKTCDDFVKGNSRTMSAGGYNTRDIFIPEEERRAYKDLHDLLKAADMID